VHTFAGIQLEVFSVAVISKLLIPQNWLLSTVTVFEVVHFLRLQQNLLQSWGRKHAIEFLPASSHNLAIYAAI